MSENGEPFDVVTRPSGNKLLTFQTLLYFIIGACPVIVSTVSTIPDDKPVTWKFLTILIAGAIGGGSISVKAFLSTTFAESKANADSKAPVPIATADGKAISATNPLPTDPTV
jgi:hypothetical protein